MISSCSFLQSSGGWSEQLPPQGYFADYYQYDIDNQLYQDQESYLAWVRVFYSGSAISIGWLQLTEDLLIEMPANKQQEYAELLAELGQRIGAEWARDNGLRLIDTRSASAWRDALIEAVSLGDLEDYMQRFEIDVNAVLAGSLSKEEIEFSRYYAEEKFEFC
ncbi:hypothetical protein JYU22_02305 [Gammaproteobacteria bacterium AH-315-E17]|nr:hypothetical protein [Gammaproteobacteria bacterium AH-315-E17]